MNSSPGPPLEHSGKSLGYFYASTVLLHDNRNYSVLFDPNTDLSRLRLRRSGVLFRGNQFFLHQLVPEVLDLNRIKTKVQLYKEEPAAKGTVAFVCIFTRQQYLRSTCICSPPRVPLRGPVRRNRPRQQISDTYKRRDWEPCSSCQWWERHRRCPRHG